MSGTGVLYVDPDEGARLAFGRQVRAEDYPTWTVAGVDEALEALRSHPAVGVALVADRDGCGRAVLAALDRARPRLVGVLATPPRARERLVAALDDGGAYRVVPLPWDAAVLRRVVREAREHHDLVAENRRLRLAARRRERGRRAEEPVDDVRLSALAVATRRLRGATATLLTLLGRALDEADPALPGHGEACLRHARAIGARLGLDEAQLADLDLAASLHDVGRLAPGEPRRVGGDWDHAVRAAGLLATLPVPARVVEAVRHHQERWDGVGGPGGLAGDAIPLLARVLAVADQMACLEAGREGPGLPEQEAREALAARSGRWLDPVIVAALLSMDDDGPVERDEERASELAGATA